MNSHLENQSINKRSMTENPRFRSVGRGAAPQASLGFMEEGFERRWPKKVHTGSGNSNGQKK